MTQRQRIILYSIIESFIASGTPIGSKTLADGHGQWSSATIRSEMNELESMGLLQHPHTSAGRAPTVAALREYVRDLPEHPAADSHFSEYAHRYLRARLRTAEAVWQSAAQAVAQLTRYTTVVVAPGQEALVSRIHLLPLRPGSALMVVVMQDGEHQDIPLRVPHDCDETQLNAVAGLLSGNVRGMTLTRVAQHLREAGEGELTRQAAAALEELALRQAQPRVAFGGTHNLPTQVADPALLERLLAITEQHDLQQQLANRLMDQSAAIAMGDDVGLEGLSVVTVALRPGGKRAAVAVIGPTRMPYATLLTQLRAAAAALESILSEM